MESPEEQWTSTAGSTPPSQCQGEIPSDGLGWLGWIGMDWGGLGWIGMDVFSFAHCQNVKKSFILYLAASKRKEIGGEYRVGC